MRLSLFFSGLCLLLAVSTCVDTEDPAQPAAVATTIDFVAKYDGANLGIQRETYDYPTGAKLKVGLFQYYVSDLTLVATDGTEVPLSEIELIRYGSPSDDEVERRTYDVPAGRYTALRFGLGVKPELNAREPSSFSAADPLNENEFWNANARYVFAKIEANADLEDDGTFDTGLSYHMGSDDLYTVVTFTGDIVIDENDPRLTLTADVLAAMSDDTETFNIADPGSQTVHGGNQAVAVSIWNRLARQFSLTVQ